MNLLISAFSKGKSRLARLEQTRKGGRGGKIIFLPEPGWVCLLAPPPPRGGSVFLAGRLAWEGSAVKATQERKPDTLINILN